MLGLGDKYFVQFASLNILICTTTQFLFPKPHFDENGEMKLQFHLDLYSNCVPLRHCETFKWILANTREFPKINSGRVFNVLKDKMCDYGEVVSDASFSMDTYIECPVGITKEDKNDIILRTDLPTSSRKSPICIGSLEFFHGSRRNPLRTVKVLKLSSRLKKVRNIKKINDRRILRIKSHGNCCWRTYKNKGFRGRFEDIYIGYDKFPRIHPQSMKKIYCR